MKRVIALFLTVALLMSVCPVHILASEDEFVGISIVLNGIEKQCRVIESGDELLFSGEDLAVFGGYTYRVDGDNAFFTRGQKTVRVNMARNILIPFDGTAYSESNKNITLNTSVREKDGVYYFPGTQLLPWLSVNCSVKNGKLHIITDEVSIWDLVGEFNPEDYAFDFAECCEALGKDSKWVKAGAAFHGFGLETVFGWLPSFGNDSNDEHDYYDIFEEMLQDQTCSQTFVDDMMEDVGKINEWMDWAEAMKVKDELPDDWKAVGMVSDFVGSAPVELSVELGMYLSAMEMDNSEKLNAIKHIVLSGGDFPDEMRAAAETIYLEYTDYILGILGKGIDVLYEALKDLTGEASYEAVKKMAGELAGDVYEIALAVLDFPEMIEYDCTEGIRRVDCYSAIASESIKEYQEYKSVISDIGIQNTRSTAYLYLYAVEQNWRTMSDYALEKGFLEYAAEYRANADAAQEMASLFLNSAFSQVNDSPEYAAGEPRRKQGYTDKLKAMFANLEKQLDLIGQEGLYLDFLQQHVEYNYYAILDTNGDGLLELFATEQVEVNNTSYSLEWFVLKEGVVESVLSVRHMTAPLSLDNKNHWITYGINGVGVYGTAYASLTDALTVQEETIEYAVKYDEDENEIVCLYHNGIDIEEDPVSYEQLIEKIESGSSQPITFKPIPKPAPSEESAYCHSYLLGDTVCYDLNGDEVFEEITVSFADDESGFDEITIEISPINYSSDTTAGKIEIETSLENATGYFTILNIDTSRSRLLLGISEYGPSDDDGTYLYSYDGMQIEEIGYFDDIMGKNSWDYDSAKCNGDGTISITTRSDVLGTWGAKATISVNANDVTDVTEFYTFADFYEYSIGRSFTTKCDIIMYTNKEDLDSRVVVPAGTIVYMTGHQHPEEEQTWVAFKRNEFEDTMWLCLYTMDWPNSIETSEGRIDEFSALDGIFYAD